MLRKIWVDNENHMGSMVCFGFPMDHLVLSPERARELGQELINAAEQCKEEKDSDADQGLSGVASDGEGSEGDGAGSELL